MTGLDGLTDPGHAAIADAGDLAVPAAAGEKLVL
jgi:hypothetical protein